MLLTSHTPVLVTLWWLLSLLESWTQALPWSSWSCQPLCHLSGAVELLCCVCEGRHSGDMSALRGATSLSLCHSPEPDSGQPHIAPNWAHTPLAKSHRNAGATESQSPSQSLSSCALETVGPVLGQRRGHGHVALLGDFPEGRQSLEKAVLGLVPQAGDILPRCPWVPARGWPDRLAVWGSMSEPSVEWGP